MAEESIDVLETGDPAAAFDLPGTGGEPHALSEYADAGYEAVLLVFTCNHCPYAKAKHPALNEIAADYDEVAVVGINSNDAESYPDDSFERMREAVADGAIAYDAYLRDESQDVAAAYGAVCTPDPFLLARDGDGDVDGTGDGAGFHVAHHGRLDDAPNPDDEPTRAEMREAIDALLAGEPIDVAERPSRGCSIKWRDGNEPAYWADV